MTGILIWGGVTNWKFIESKSKSVTPTPIPSPSTPKPVTPSSTPPPSPTPSPPKFHFSCMLHQLLRFTRTHIHWLSFTNLQFTNSSNLMICNPGTNYRTCNVCPACCQSYQMGHYAINDVKATQGCTNRPIRYITLTTSSANITASWRIAFISCS